MDTTYKKKKKNLKAFYVYSGFTKEYKGNK